MPHSARPTTAAVPAAPRLSALALVLLLVLPLALLLAGCGDTTPPEPAGPAQAQPGQTRTPAVEASAEAVARNAREGLRCPAPPADALPAGVPVDDVVGVRPGMTWAEAWQRVLCSHPMLVAAPDPDNRFRLPPSDPPVRQGFEARAAEARVHKTGRQIVEEMQADMMARGNNKARRPVAPGQARWYVGTMGMPGDERVTHVLREEWYAADALPPMDSVLQALVAKYGEPTRRTGGGASRSGRPVNVELTWVHDPAGRRVGAREPLASQCGLHPSPDAGVNLSEACGVVVSAQVQPLPDNPGLAQALRVGSVDQARGYARVAATGLALQQRQAERRAREVQEAGRQAKTPTL